MLSKITDHIRNRDYMSGVERDTARVKATGEVFTPTPLVQEILNQLPLDQFTDPNKTFLDNSCGDGQFLSEVIIKKMEHGSTYEQALSTTYGVDLMVDNCIECIRRLYGVETEPNIVTLSTDYLSFDDLGPIHNRYAVPLNWQSTGLKAVFEVNGKICNIVCADGLKYDYSFGENESEELGINLFGFNS
jgi:hypothetical protein